jgi:hypothetical protein
LAYAKLENMQNILKYYKILEASIYNCKLQS